MDRNYDNFRSVYSQIIGDRMMQRYFVNGYATGFAYYASQYSPDIRLVTEVPWIYKFLMIQ